MATKAQSKQSGGGSATAAETIDDTIKSFEPTVLGCLKELWKTTDHKKFPDLPSYLKYMSSSESNATLPALPTSLKEPLSSYFISASHNTYLTGHQLYGSANVDGYKNVLLRGCRCVEIDCWNGDEDNDTEFKIGQAKTTKASVVEPVVLHGYTATKEITFRSVCQIIRDYAFKTTDLPLILSLEVHTNQAQQQMMVDIMNEYFKDMLCKVIEEGDLEKMTALELPTPDSIRNKILIKVKYSPPAAKTAVLEQEVKAELVPASRVSSSTSDDDEATAKTEKKSKIISALGQMGIYTRSYHFSSLTQPEAAIPTHIFSLSESSLTGVYKEDPQGLFDHNKRYLMRTYPKAIRISSSNLDPSLFWRVGVQMVALNWQRVDKGMMLQEAMFTGTGGWSLKPEAFLSKASYEQSLAHWNSGKSWLNVSILAGQNIPLPPDFDPDDKFKPYIKCEVHVDTKDLSKDEKQSSKKENKLKKKIGPVKGRNPQFDGHRDFLYEELPPIVPELSFIRLKVLHSKFGQDKFAAWACIRLDRLATGPRFIHLWDSKGMPTDGVLLAKIDYGWNVAPKSVVTGR